MRLLKAEFKRITFALFVILLALTFVQCIFVVGGGAVAESPAYRELISDYFSFNAPTRIAACGKDFAVFDSGRVILFRNGAHTSFDTEAEECDKLVLSGMTLGHTDRGECWGSVIDLLSCDSVILNNMDLYGCGVIGLNLEYCSNFLKCTDVTIRDCSSGPLCNSGSRGEWKFYNCNLTGSDSGGFFSEAPALSLYFENCTFGDRESENFMFREDTTTKNCTWGNVSTPPDYSGYDSGAPDAVIVNDMKVTSFDSYMRLYREWTGFEIIDDTTGEISETGQWVYFNDDGTGEIYDDISGNEFTWTIDSNYSAVITMDDGSGEYGVTIYIDKTKQESPLFMVLSQNGKSSWYY